MIMHKAVQIFKLHRNLTRRFLIRKKSSFIIIILHSAIISPTQRKIKRSVSFTKFKRAVHPSVLYVDDFFHNPLVLLQGL